MTYRMLLAITVALILPMSAFGQTTAEPAQGF